MTFVQRFKQLRLEKGFKQQELLDDFNKIYGYTFTKSSISQYENNKRRPETDALKDFALYFNVSVDYLLGITDQKNAILAKKKMDQQHEALDFINNFFKNKDISREEKDNLFEKFSKIYFNSMK